MIISKLNDKFYKNYNNLFIKKYNNFMLINNYILYNFISTGLKNICNVKFTYSLEEQKYDNIILQKHKNLLKLHITKLYSYPIPNLDISNYLIITNILSIIYNNYSNKKNIDIILYYNYDYDNSLNNKYIKTLVKFKEENEINSNLDIYINKLLYLNFLTTLKNNNNIIIKKYKLITCHYGYEYGLSLSASYKMLLEIPNIISTIAMSIKYIEKWNIAFIFYNNKCKYTCF